MLQKTMLQTFSKNLNVAKLINKINLQFSDKFVIGKIDFQCLSYQRLLFSCQLCIKFDVTIDISFLLQHRENILK